MIACIVIAIILLLVGIVITVWACIEEGFEGIYIGLASLLVIGIIDFFLISPFVALDKSSGTTIGTITAVDKNFFGTYTIYLKTAENNEDKYCAENQEIVEIAKELIGEKVQLYYGERIGLYHLNQCRMAPIEKIELKGEK